MTLASVFWGDEHIADTTDCPDRIGMGGVALDLAPQPGNAQVDGTIERVCLAVRRNLQQPVAHQWPVRVLGEDLQQIELACGEALFIAVGRVDQYAPLKIENAPANANPTGLRRRPDGPSQYALDPRQQFTRLERLGNVVVGAAFFLA